MKPVGAPFRVGSWLRLRCVLAMQMGSLSKPCRVYSSIFFSASGRYSTPAPPYISRTMVSIFSLMLVSQRIEELEVAGLLAGRDDGLGQIDRARAALGPVVRS